MGLDDALDVKRGDRRGAVDDAPLQLVADPQPYRRAAQDEDREACDEKSPRQGVGARQTD